MIRGSGWRSRSPWRLVWRLGLFNGFGVAYLRLPSMILTPGHERGAAGAGGNLHRGLRAADQGIPADARVLGKDSSIAGVPNILWVWLAGSALLVVLLRRTPFGRKIYAIGNRERAAYLSGIRTARVVMTCFVISGF